MKFFSDSRNHVDKTLLYTALFLLTGGILILSSASMVLSQKNFDNAAYHTIRQFLLGGLFGVFLMYICSRINYRFWKKTAILWVLFSFALLAALFLPGVGLSFGGATRWISLGFFSFQPSEILKLAFIIYLASWLDARRQQVRSVSYGLMPFSIMIGVVGVFLVMQPDFGTLGIIILTSGAIYLLGGGKLSQIFTLTFLVLALVILLIQISPYRLARVNVFLNPELDPQGAGYHVNQASIAIGSGGFLGLGFGKSLQKYNYLPEPMGDSIFAIFAEEMGFLGTLILLGIFSFLFWRGFYIAKRAPDAFASLLAGGISIGIAVQVVINIAAISGLLPLTGVPLPFVSYGGTSLAITLASIGILLNISRHTD